MRLQVPQRYFFDTSALIARFLGGATGRAWVLATCDPAAGNTIAIAEITAVELVCTLNQLARGGTIRKSRRDRAIASFWQQIDQQQYHLFSVTWTVIRRAAGLSAIHALRGYDAVQLACALAYRDDARLADAQALSSGGTPLGDPVFVTEDRRLSDAAAAEGFAVDSPLLHP